MAAIQIQESEPFLITSDSTTQQAAWKYVVSQLLALNPMLNLNRVDKDTSSEYTVYVEVADSHAGFRISCYGSSLAIARCWFDANGSFWFEDSQSVSSFFTGGTGYHVKVSTVGVEGALKYVVFTSEAHNGKDLYLSYGMFTHDGKSDPVYVVYSGTALQSSTWPTPSPVPVVHQLPSYKYDSEADKLIWVGFVYFQSNHQVWARAGYPYALIQCANHGYTEKEGFVNVKWGGLYDLYYLVRSGGEAVITNFGETVSINGVSTLSGGTVALIV